SHLTAEGGCSEQEAHEDRGHRLCSVVRHQQARGRGETRQQRPGRARHRRGVVVAVHERHPELTDGFTAPYPRGTGPLRVPAIKRFPPRHSKIALCGLTRTGTIGSGQLCRCATTRDGVRMKKNLRYVAIAFLIFYLLSSPTDAANVVNNAFSQLGEAGNQLAAFVNALGT